MLADEYGTASNIKSRVNRLSVLGAITSVQHRLKLYAKVPPNGLVRYIYKTYFIKIATYNVIRIRLSALMLIWITLNLGQVPISDLGHFKVKTCKIYSFVSAIPDQVPRPDPNF